MLIGILKTDSVLPDLAARFGEYPDMFAALLHREDPDLVFATWDIVGGEIPSDPGECDAWLITGSRHSVYEDHPWIPPLEEFVRSVHATGGKLIGVCFGHQLVARALGGKTGKADAGWTIGVQPQEILEPFSWAVDQPRELDLIHSHQDQVLRLPEGARQVGRSPTCPNAMFQVGENIMTVQGHPEFSPEYARALYPRRREVFGDELCENAVASLDTGHDAALMARWMVAFLRFKPAQEAKTER